MLRHRLPRCLSTLDRLSLPLSVHRTTRSTSPRHPTTPILPSSVTIDANSTRALLRGVHPAPTIEIELSLTFPRSPHIPTLAQTTLNRITISLATIKTDPRADVPATLSLPSPKTLHATVPSPKTLHGSPHDFIHQQSDLYPKIVNPTWIHSRCSLHRLVLTLHPPLLPIMPMNLLLYLKPSQCPSLHLPMTVIRKSETLPCSHQRLAISPPRLPWVPRTLLLQLCLKPLASTKPIPPSLPSIPCSLIANGFASRALAMNAVVARHAATLLAPFQESQAIRSPSRAQCRLWNPTWNPRATCLSSSPA